jgi:hypothetical protein
MNVASAEAIRSQLELDLRGPGEVDSILSQADEIVSFTVERIHKEYTSRGQARREVEIPKLQNAATETPKYLPDYLDLVERLHADPAVARSLLQTTELACFDALPGGSAWRSSAFSHLFSAEHRGLLLVALRTLEVIAGAAVSDRLRQLREIPFYGPRRGTPPTIDQ